MRLRHWRHHGVWLGIGALAGAVALPASSALAAAGAWSVVAAPNPAVQFTYLQSVDATSDSNAWAVGYVQPPTGGPFQPVSLHWNGTAWSSVAAPQLGDAGTLLFGVSSSQATDAWAVGDALSHGYRAREKPVALHWNGAAWTATSVPDTSFLFGVADLSPANAWAIGLGVKHWDGTAWSDVATPSPNPSGVGAGNLLGISARTASDVWAVGTFNPVRHRTASFTLHFDGTAWHLVATPAGAVLDSVAAAGPGDAWAVGSLTATNQPVTEHWDGTAWSIVATATVPNGGSLRSVTARAGNDVWAAGTGFTGDANTAHPLTLHWDGTAWSTVPSPPAATSAQALAVSARPGTTRTWAVGTQDVGLALILERH